LGVDSGREFSGHRTIRAWHIAGGRVMGRKVISPCRLCEVTGDRIGTRTDLKGLGIPILNSFDGQHITKVVW
jgi:hypothetical protein